MNDLEQFKDVGFVCVQLFDIYIYYDWAVTGKILVLFQSGVEQSLVEQSGEA